MKACTNCEEVKPLAEYHMDRKKSDGRQSLCKACKNVNRSPRYEQRFNRTPTPEHMKKAVFTDVIVRMAKLGICSEETAKDALERVGCKND